MIEFITQNLETLLAFITGGGLLSFATLKYTRKQAEANAMKAGQEVYQESTLKDGNYEYYIINNIINDISTLISCSIRKEIDGVVNEVGNIRKENGQVNSFIREDEDYILHITKFSEVVKEIDSNQAQ